MAQECFVFRISVIVICLIFEIWELEFIAIHDLVDLRFRVPSEVDRNASALYLTARWMTAIPLVRLR